MKKVILFVVLTIVIVPVAYTQSAKLALGPKIGATFSSFNTDNGTIKEEIKSTFHWGAFVRFGNAAYFQPELLFMKRSGVLVDINDPVKEQTVSLRTIDVPMLLGVRVANLELLDVRIFAGPVASIAVNKDIKAANWDDALTKKDIRAANWAVQFGGGVDLRAFTFDLRYELGMSDFSKLESLTLKNNLITLSVGLKII